MSVHHLPIPSHTKRFPGFIVTGSRNRDQYDNACEVHSIPSQKVEPIRMLQMLSPPPGRVRIHSIPAPLFGGKGGTQPPKKKGPLFQEWIVGRGVGVREYYVLCVAAVF